MRHLITITAIGCAAWVGIALAGDTNPPAGPVAGTMKTLGEVEPRIAINATNTPGDNSALYVISQPGTYYLTADVVPPTNRNGIRIAADGVSIDLNGFAIDGSFTTFRAGITSLGSVTSGGRISNGTVRNWASLGVSLLGEGSVVEDLIVRNCAGGGIQLPDRSTARSCTLIDNGGNSIRSFDSCVIEDCVISTSATAAISATSANIIRNNNISLSTGAGAGISAAGISSRIEGNNISGIASGTTGILGASNCLVVRNTVSAGITTPFSLASAAKFGPIIPTDGDLSGIPNANHPWANFVY